MVFLLGCIFGIFTLIQGQTVTISLAGTGSTSSQGRVEITRNGITGTVCDDQFNDLAAAVVCRQLGFQNGGTAVTDGRFGPGTGPIWLDDVVCQGNELHIEMCLSRPWNNSNCGHAEDVGVICNVNPVASSTPPATSRAPATVQPSNCTTPSNNIRLVGPSNLNGIGYVEVNRNGVWGSVCDDSWGKEDAKVVCRMLCFDPNIAQAGAPIDITYVQDQVSKTFLLDDVQCVGTETDIDQCRKSAWGVHNCDPNGNEFASVTCVQLENKQPEAPIPELECSGGKFYARFSRIQDPNLEEKHLSIFYPYNGPCNPEFQTTTDTVSMIIAYSECGTATTVNTTHIFYTNSIKYDYTIIENQIVRVNTYRIEVTCQFPRNLNDSEGYTPLTETVTQKAPGRFNIFMTFYNDSFLTSLNGSIELTLGEWLNVALTLEAIDPNLKLVVPDCKATPTNDPNDPTFFDLFSDKCAKDPTLGFFPLNSTVFGFRYQTFKFVAFSNVIVQCDAFVCLLSEKNAECDRSCNNTETGNTGRRKRDVSSSRDIYRVISPPVRFATKEDGVLIDRGDGWEVNYVTTTGAATLSMTTTVEATKVSRSSPTQAPKTSSTFQPVATTKVFQVTTSPIVAISSTTRSPIIPSTTTSATTMTSLKSSTQTTTTSTTSTTPSGMTSKPTLKLTTHTKTTNSSSNNQKSTSSTSKAQESPFTSTSKPNDWVRDPNKLYEGGLGENLNILSKASGLPSSNVTQTLISLIVILLYKLLR